MKQFLRVPSMTIVPFYTYKGWVKLVIWTVYMEGCVCYTKPDEPKELDIQYVEINLN